MSAMEIKLEPGEYYRANHKRFKRISRALRYTKFNEKGIGEIYIEKFKNPTEVCPISRIALKDILSLMKYCKSRSLDVIKDRDKIIPIAEYFWVPINSEGKKDYAIIELDLDMLNGNNRFNVDEIVEYEGKKYSIGYMYYHEIKVDDNSIYTPDKLLNTELNLDNSRIFTNFYWITEVGNPEQYLSCGNVYSRELKKIN